MSECTLAGRPYAPALLRAYATHSVTDGSWAAKREWGMMSAAVLAGMYVVTNVCSLFEDMTAAVGAALVTTTVVAMPPVYLLAAARQSVARREGKAGSTDDAGGGGEAGGGVGAATSAGLHVMLLFGLVVIPLTVWGAVVRLSQDARNVAAPFSCGPCVTRECIEEIRNASYVTVASSAVDNVSSSMGAFGVTRVGSRGLMAVDAAAFSTR